MGHCKVPKALFGAAFPIKPNLAAIPDEQVVQAKVAKNSPFRFHLYGFQTFGQVSTVRQQIALAEICKNVRNYDRDPYVRTLLEIVVNRLVNACTSLCRWDNTRESLQGMFTRQAISMVWDFCENAPFGDATGGLGAAAEWVEAVIAHLTSSRLRIGMVEQADATVSPLGNESCSVWFTDPPYYDAVSYADLSDFFFAWLKRTHPTPDSLHDPYEAGNPLTPKLREAIQDDTKFVDGVPKDRAFFETTMAKAFAEGRRVIRDDGIGAVVFAHKTTEGWEALLSGLSKGGWVVTGSWPIATKTANRLRARDSAALATSVHLVCRPRVEEVVGDWADVLGELPERVGEWMARLEREGVHGADLVFACIGPALEIFSRYSRVETPEGVRRRVAKELHEGLLGAEYDRSERIEVQTEVRTAEDTAKDQVWGGYRFIVVSDAKSPTGLKVIDLGAGHASSSETLCGRIIGELKNDGLLNEVIGAGYLDRHWPPAFKDSGAWPLASLRQSFLNGTLTRLIDPDPVLRTRIAEFVSAGEFGLASGAEPDGKYRRVWFREDVGPAEIAFEADVYLLTKAPAGKLKSPETIPISPSEPEPVPPTTPATPETPRPDGGGIGSHAIISVAGSIPPEQWNRLGTRLLPKMRAAGTVTASIRLEIKLDESKAPTLSTELRQIVDENGLSATVRVEQRAAD
jgi:hypothetical protein